MRHKQNELDQQKEALSRQIAQNAWGPESCGHLCASKLQGGRYGTKGPGGSGMHLALGASYRS